MSDIRIDLQRTIQIAVDDGLDADAVMAKAREVAPAATDAEVFAIADELADLGAVDRRLAPPAEALGRRDLLRSLVVGGAAAAGLAAVGSMPRAARAAEGDAAAEVCEAGEAAFRNREQDYKRVRQVQFRERTQEKRAKVRDRAQEEAQKLPAQAGEERRKLADKTREQDEKVVDASQEQADRLRSRERTRKRLATRYQTAGRAPIYIESEGADEIQAEVEESSVRTSGDGCIGTTLDIYVDALGGDRPVKELLGDIERLAPLKPGGESPLLTVTWGAFGDQLFEGFLDTVDVAYTAYDRGGEPVRAVLHCTFVVG